MWYNCQHRKGVAAMKIQKRIAIALLLILTLTGCGGNREERKIAAEERRTRRRCAEIVSMYQALYDAAPKREPESPWDAPELPQQDIDTVEQALIDRGLCVVDSGADSPEYLANSEKFYQFLDAVEQNENVSREVLRIRPSGALSYRLFSHRDGTTTLYSMTYSPDETVEPDYEVYRICETKLTEQGNFYYRIHPEDDHHYANYTRLRLKQPDKELWQQCARYVLAGGYTGTNIFLSNWTEKDFSGLCFNDVWEYLYRYQNGARFSPDGYTFDTDKNCYRIPAAEFEGVILPFFQLSQENLRQLAGYDSESDSYPWRQIESNDYVFYLNYYTIEPEVTAFRNHSDGTVSITVALLSTDLGVDCLFSHELTVRPQADGSFQFVGNRMLTQTELGLPFCDPRLTWEIAG